MNNDLHDLIYEIAHAEQPPRTDGTSWSPEELHDVLTRAAALDVPTLKRVAAEVGIHFTDDEDASVEDYLEVLDEADDKDKLKRLLKEQGA